MVYKNKNRQFNDVKNKQKHNKHAPYEPNYQRLGVEPVIKDYQTDFTPQATRNRTQTVSQPISNGVKEYAWTDGIRDAAHSNMENGVDSVDGGKVEDPNSEVFHPQAKSTNNYPNQRVPQPSSYEQFNQEEEDDSFSLNGLADNTYVLLYQEDIVVFGDRQLVERTIEEIITENEGINVDEFCIVKKLGFSTGVHISNE